MCSHSQSSHYTARFFYACVTVVSLNFHACSQRMVQGRERGTASSCYQIRGKNQSQLMISNLFSFVYYALHDYTYTMSSLTMLCTSVCHLYVERHGHHGRSVRHTESKFFRYVLAFVTHKHTHTIGPGGRRSGEKGQVKLLR